ncbi:hypothetical protein C0Q70_13015 [Pomacea canaliculata]|uniref:EF-hand domain-containing protein n=1 Tax=Pomacea canaliculata TaxID=400727 RepID=A0A2T7P355_POMCA|nr:hypothetical protein C0Q70_13015 [Pomacea canaliculata]
MKVLILSCLLAVALGIDYDGVKKSFDATDINHDGIIRPDEILTLFTKTDANNDGNITAEEFTALYQPGTPEVNQGYFNYYDKLDGAADGVISMAVAQLLFDVFDAGRLATTKFKDLSLLSTSTVMELYKDKTITIEEYTATHVPGTPELVIQGNFNYYDKQDGAADGVISLSIVPVLFDIFDADGECDCFDTRTLKGRNKRDKTNRLPQLFYLIDSDNDGVININEMKAGYDSEDANGDGVLTFDEFAAGSHPGSPPLDLQSAFDFFDELDQKKDGKVDMSAVAILFNGLDEDYDGVLTLAEFSRNYSLMFGENTTDEST